MNTNWKKILVFWIAVVGAIFLAHNYSGFLEEMVVSCDCPLSWILLALWYLVWVGILGTIAGKIFGVTFK